MTQDVETFVRRNYDAWNAGDLDALLSMADPDIVFRTSGAFPDLESEYRGHEGMRRYWETIRGAFMDLAIEVERVTEVGDEILILFRFRGKMSSGLEATAEFGQVGQMRDGLVTSIVAYPDWASAERAVGLHTY